MALFSYHSCEGTAMIDLAAAVPECPVGMTAAVYERELKRLSSAQKAWTDVMERRAESVLASAIRLGKPRPERGALKDIEERT